nr:ABC transporter ATP-binding protein [uncultured Niameybacter sp.]
MKQPSRKLRKLILQDCRKAMIPSTIWYLVDEGGTALLMVYMASILGAFADAVFSLNLALGTEQIGKILICVGIMVVVIPSIGMIGEVIMFDNCLKHDRIILGRFLDKEYEEVMRIPEGEAQHRLEEDPIELRCYWQDIVVRCIVTPIVFLYLIVKGGEISLIFTGLTFLISLIKLLVPIMVKKLEARYDLETRAYKDMESCYEREIIAQPHIVKMYGLKDSMINRLNEMYYTYFKEVQVKSIVCQTVSKNILGFLDTFCVLIILLIGAIMVVRGILTPGAVTAMVGYFSIFNLIMSNIDFLIRKVPILRNTVTRMEIIYSDAEALEGKEIEQPLSIIAEDVNFSYGEREILKGVNFEMSAGNKVVIAGANGSGKSTLIKVLCGLVKGYKGSIKINNIQLNEVDIGTWRKQIGYVPQTPYLFEGTVKENIHMGNLAATEEEVDRIMQHMDITYLSERAIGVSQKDLSGGEKQKISIARALLKDTPILIFDEPNNNLDQESLLWVKDFIAKTERTVLFVWHDYLLENKGYKQLKL